jgi:hypothetical protein
MTRLAIAKSMAGHPSAEKARVRVMRRRENAILMYSYQ